MSFNIEKVEASLYVKSIYIVSLALVILQFLGKVPYAIKLLSQVGRNPNIMNPIIAIVLLATAAVIVIFLGGRLVQLVQGKENLNVVITSNRSKQLRIFSLLLLSIGVFIKLSVFTSLFFIRGGGQIVIAHQFAFAIPLGLVLFELSRLIEFEKILTKNNA